MIRLLKDLWLEYRISYALHRFVKCPSRYQYQVYAKLLMQRSQYQITRMEQERGLV